MTNIAYIEQVRTGESVVVGLIVTPRTATRWREQNPDLTFAWAPAQVPGGKVRVHVSRPVAAVIG